MYIFEAYNCDPKESRVYCWLKKKRKDAKKYKSMWWAVLYGQFIDWKEKKNV